MARLGRSKGLLERKRLENGNTLMGRIVSFIGNNKGGLLTILGHPSAGKTTEFNRLARDLSSNSKFANEFFPLYTELQNAEISNDQIENQFIWKGIISGSIDIQVHGEKASESLEEFCKHCESHGKKPLLLIDTLDILMLHQVGDSGVNVAKLWADFLQTVIDKNATMIWTCRPFEWKYFQREINGNYLNKIEVEELPPLEKDQLKPFTEITSLELSNQIDEDEDDDIESLFGDSKTTEPVWKNFVSDPNDTAGWPEQEAWEKWTINFQSHMPIFADRWSNTTKKARRLDDDLFIKFAEDFRNYTQSDLSKSHWYEFVKVLPSQYLYSWIWDKISKRMEETYSISEKLVLDLKSVFEIEARKIALNDSDTSSRVRLEYNHLSDVMKGKCGIDEVTVNDLFNVCESRGLLSRNGIWVDFSHQLLFEESILNSNPDDDEKRQLQKFPSILLRTKRDVRTFTKSEDILRDEVMNAIGNWTGYMLAYHPVCISIKSNLNPTWSKWVDYSHDNVSIKVPDLEVNEHTEKRIALQDYEQSEGIKSLIVNGAPGTGKTYFCRDYLRWILARNRLQNRTVKWRYYTLNNHLSEHFDELISEYSERDPEMKSDLENSSGGSFSIDRLLSFINPSINRHKSINDKSGLGLLTFSVFKVLIRQYFNQKRVRHSGVKCPPLADAWILYNEVLHDPITGARRQDMDKKKFVEHNTQTYRMNSKMIDWFIKFHQEELEELWWTYSYAASDCRNRLDNISDVRKNQYLIDVLIVDEVQDINPPVMALLLELMRPGYQNHSIMIAGDMVQTVNRSGFQWINFSEMTAQSLKDSSHPDRSRLIQFGVFDKSELDKNRTTLKYVWRNGQRLVEFNNKMRKNYASSFGISEQYSALFDYPGGELLISEASRMKDLDSEITIIESESVDDYYDLINELSKASKDLVGEDIAVIAPFEIEEIWNEKFKIPVYDAESVKGLEFEGIVVLMPYMIPENEARSSLIRRLGESNDDVQSQIQKWCDAWKENKGDASMVNFENFNQLFLNVMTRMNVLFSRPEKRILVINPVRFGGEVQIFDHPKNDEKMMSFGIPQLPRDVKINSRNDMSMIETLRIPIGEYSDKSQSYSKLLSKALNQASLNDDGTQTDNERKVWDNLWFNLEGDDKAPLSAIAYAGGLKYHENIDIVRLLRSDLGRDFGLLEGKAVGDKENQLINAIVRSKIDPETGDLTLMPDTAHYIFSNLDELLRSVMKDSHGHQKLHEFMMNRLFGIDTSRIEDYDFHSFLEENISIDSMSIAEFSKGIDVNNGFVYKINKETKNDREIVLYHLASRLSSVDVVIDFGQVNWVDETGSLWNSIINHIDKQKFDSEIIRIKENNKLVKWMQNEFTGTINQTSIKSSTSRPAKSVATNRKDWKELVSSGKTSPKHKAAWKILTEVIPSINSSRNTFDPSSEFYLTIYDSLGLSIDLDGMRILHEVLEHSFKEMHEGQDLAFSDTYDIVVKRYTKSLDKGKTTFDSKMMNSLEKQWLLRDVNRITHEFKSSRGASVIGALIHITYMLTSKGSKKGIAGGPPFISTVEKELNKFYASSRRGLQNNSTEYWLKYNLQDLVFRKLLAKLLLVNIDDIQAKTKGNLETFLCRLSILDFVAMTDKNWKSPSRRDPGINGFVPDFSGSGPDDLTNAIFDMVTQLNQSRSIKFFRHYIENLDMFLDLEDLERQYKVESKKKGNENLTESKYRNRYPNKYLNIDMWYAWEWLLNMIKGTKSESYWTGMHSGNSREEIELRKSRRKLLHNYLRLNNEDDFDYIQNQVYVNQYLPIVKDLITAETRNSKVYHMNNILDFTESKLNKSNTDLKWSNVQRIILNHALIENGYSKFYIDWDICLQLLRRLPDWPRELSDMDKLLNYCCDTLVNQWAIYRTKNDESKGVTVSELLSSALGGRGNEHFTRFVSKLENINELVMDTLELDSTGPTKTAKRMKNTYFNKDRKYRVQRNIIADAFVSNIMSDLGFTRTQNFRNTKNGSQATDRVYLIDGQGA
jgi:hypothetical protein